MRWKFWPSSNEKKVDLEKRGISLLERTIKSIPAVLIGIVLTFFLSRSGLFRQLETYALDTQARLHETAEDTDVVVVRIDDEDYAKLFHQKSPLDHNNLLKIIKSVAAGKPRVIGIDIETTAPQFQELKPEPNWPVVVWARNGVFSQRDGKYHLFQLLGGQEANAVSGIVVMQLDPDGAIRRYPRVCETDHGPVDSFVWAVAKQYDPANMSRHKPTEEGLFINFAGDSEGRHRLHFTASRILELADGPGWQSDSPIKDKIVLIGGGYSAADEHDTPLGWMLGVEVLANAVETELHGGGLPPPSPILVTALSGLIGLFLLMLFQHFTPLKGFLLSFLLIPLTGMLASLAVFRTLAFWAYFAPIPLAVLVQEIYAQAKDYRKKLIKDLYEDVLGKSAEKKEDEAKPQEATKETQEAEVAKT